MAAGKQLSNVQDIAAMVNGKGTDYQRMSEFEREAEALKLLKGVLEATNITSLRAKQEEIRRFLRL